MRVVLAFFHVRKHRAPKGALRRAAGRCEAMLHDVRKHRAPKGALRRDEPRRAVLHEVAGQKAPSAKRCIKTRVTPVSGVEAAAGSESTERQKVH